MATSANQKFIKHKFEYNSVNLTDNELKFSVFLAESHP